MESRIKMLREKRGLIQELLAVEIGVTQQMLSKYEKDITIIKVDVLKRIAEYFNVTTDYLLGLSDMKRDLSGQIKMNETLDEYYDLIEVYRRMDMVKFHYGFWQMYLRLETYQKCSECFRSP